MFDLNSMKLAFLAASAITLGAANTATAGHEVANHFRPGTTVCGPQGCQVIPTPFKPPIHEWRRYRRTVEHQHAHSWTIVCEREWCPPVYRTVIVGYDSCGTPVRRQILVTPGMFKVARYKVCGCGDKIFLGYD